MRQNLRQNQGKNGDFPNPHKCFVNLYLYMNFNVIVRAINSTLINIALR